MKVWTRRDDPPAQPGGCLVCGVQYGIGPGEVRLHKPATCGACHTVQCWVRGLSRGQCAVCLTGLLDAFRGHDCGYKGCGRPAVSAAPIVRYACADHLKPRQREIVAARLAARDEGWREVEIDGIREAARCTTT